MKIGILDFETTGFDPSRDFLCEMGLVSLDSETGEIETLYDSCIREPGMSWAIKDAWIFKNSPMEIDDVRNAPMFEDQKPAMQAALDSCDVVTAFNNKFDFKWSDARGLTFIKWDCPMLAATPVCRIPHKKKAGFKWPSVEEAWRHFFPKELYVEIHRGADDAYHEAKIVWALLQGGHMTLPKL
jgi:DNA polymerase-3 subunit epsilon